MDKKLFFLLLLITSIGSAQPNIVGRLTIGKTDNKEFILRNTQVMLITPVKTDSATIAKDLTFSFDGVETDSATIYLKSPVVSPNAVIKLKLRARKPTKLTINYAAMHDYPSDEPQKSDRDFAGNFLTLLQALAIVFTALHK